MKVARIIFFALMFFADYGFAQSQKSFDKLVSETNDYLEQYSSLHPFGGYYAIKDFKLSKKELNELLKDDNVHQFLNANKDSIEAYYIISYIQEKIIDNIYSLTSHDKFLENDISKLLRQADLAIVVSDDKKLYNFSLDEKTGGTYRSRLSVMYFTEFKEGSMPHQYNSEEESKTDPYSIFTGDGFGEISTIETPEGTKYVLTHSVRGCSYCFGTGVMLVKYEQDAFKQEFAYDVALRSWEEGVIYNPETKTITVDYETDDLTKECDCTNAAKPEEIEKESDVIVTEGEEDIKKRCHCTFQFNGLNFELTKECQEKVQE